MKQKKLAVLAPPCYLALLSPALTTPTQPTGIGVSTPASPQIPQCINCWKSAQKSQLSGFLQYPVNPVITGHAVSSSCIILIWTNMELGAKTVDPCIIFWSPFRSLPPEHPWLKKTKTKKKHCSQKNDANKRNSYRANEELILMCLDTLTASSNTINQLSFISTQPCDICHSASPSLCTTVKMLAKFSPPQKKKKKNSLEMERRDF